MATLRIKGDAIAAHQAMHELGLHHDAPELIEVGGVLTLPDDGAFRFTTRERPEEIAGRIRELVPGAEIEVKRLFGWQTL